MASGDQRELSVSHSGTYDSIILTKTESRLREEKDFFTFL